MRSNYALAALVACIAAVSSALAGNNAPPTPFNVPGGAPRLSSQSKVPAPLLDVPASQRPPTPADSTSTGFAVNNLWRDQSGLMWQAQRVTAGQAVWTPYSPMRRIGDAGSPVPAAIYGVCKLRSAYAGSAIRLTRVSDSTTQDVGFGANGCIDGESGDSFCVGTTCYITTWYDQSGSALDATGTTTNGPVWNRTATVNGTRALTFGSVHNSTTNMSAVARYLTLPAGLVWTPSSSSFFMVGKNTNSKQATIINAFLMNAAGTRGFGNGFNYSGMTTIGVGTACSTTVPASPAVWGFTMSSSVMTCYAGNQSGTAVYTSQSSSNGGTIGSTTASQSGVFDLQALVMWTSTLNSTDAQSVLGSLSSQFGIPFQGDEVWIVDGDSMSMGHGSIYANNWPKLTAPFLRYTTDVFTVAVYGAIIDGASGQLAKFSTNVAPICAARPGRRCIVTLLIGANDIRAGTSVSTILTDIAAYADAVHALSANAVFALATYPLQCDIFNNSTFRTNLQSLNNSIYSLGLTSTASGGLGADVLIDFFADPTLGPGNYASSSFCSNTTNSPDGQHPTDYLMGYYAPIAAAAINGLSR